MQIGAHTYHAENIKVEFNAADLIVGKFCSIGDRVTVLLGGNHRQDWISTYPFNVTAWPDLGHIESGNATKGNTIIGNDVWIGQDVLILSGVTIGDGAVIAARSVVTKNVGPYELWAGNPARCKRQRFPQSVIDELLDLKWWDWPDDKIHRAATLLMSSDVEALKAFAIQEGLHG
jgi:acetyltransferase-like isoleucine patch superfamily enzyme